MQNANYKNCLSPFNKLMFIGIDIRLNTAIPLKGYSLYTFIRELNDLTPRELNDLTPRPPLL